MMSAVLLGVGLPACTEAPSEIVPDSSGSGTAGTTGSGTAGTTGSTTAPEPTAGPDGSTSVASGSASGEDGSSGVDSTAGTTVAVEGSGSSSDGTTGEPSAIGCADGTREALPDEAQHPDIAACAGGFWVPGVDVGMPACDREGGNDGPRPDGMGCSIEDLCADGWHLCASRHEVLAAGLSDCNGVAWNSQFFATAQSGEGSNTCDPTGTNDVFGCGDVGYTNIDGCAPLNRSTGNLCVELAGPWACNDDAYDEVSYLRKPGPDYGGALCCRDGL